MDTFIRRWMAAAAAALLAGGLTATALPAHAGGGPALVSAGSVASSLSPSFGAATQAGDLLVADLFSNSSSATDPFSTTASGWQEAKAEGGPYEWASLWYKAGSSSGETAPVFSDVGTGTLASSRLSEYSGVATSAPLDQAAAGSGDETQTATASAADAQAGDLVVASAGWNSSNSGPTTITSAIKDSSGSAITTTAVNDASTSGGWFYDFSYGVAGASLGSSADTSSDTLGVYSGGASVLASFAPSSGGGTQQAPAVTTTAASGVTSSAATLNGTVNPEGADASYKFDYGTTASYGSSTTAGDAGSGSSAVNESASLSGLTASTTYHYRVEATNSGGTSYGSDQTFTTSSGGGGGYPAESPSWGKANLISYADSDFESGTGNWVSYSNSTVSQDTTQAYLHADSLQMVSGTAGSQAIKMGSGSTAPQVSVTGGDTYRESAWVKLPSALSGRTVTFADGFYNSSGTWIGWTSGAAVTLVATTNWQYVENTITAPSVAASMVGSPRVTEAGVAAGEALNLDEVLVVPQRAATLIGAEDTSGDGTSFSGTNTAIGPLQSDKIFYSASSALPSSYSGSICANLPASVTCLISYKVQNTNVASYVGSIPAGRNVIFTFWQEPEATFSGGGATYVSDFETQASLIRSSTTSSNRANVFVAADANGYQYAAGTGHNNGGAGGACGFTPPSSSVDFYLGDFYEPTASGSNLNTDSYVKPMWQGWLGCVSSQGKPIGIAEYGLNYTCNGCANALSTSQAFAADNSYLEADPDGLPVMMWQYWYDNNANGYFEFTAGGSPDGTQAVDQWQSDETQNGGGAN